MAVGPVDALSHDVQGDAGGDAQAPPHQLHAVAAVHEGPLQLHVLAQVALVREEHVPAQRGPQVDLFIYYIYRDRYCGIVPPPPPTLTLLWGPGPVRGGSAGSPPPV